MPFSVTEIQFLVPETSFQWQRASIVDSRKCVTPNKRAKMALNHSPVFKVVIVQIVCVVIIQSESAWALTNITSGNTCHAKFHAT